MKRYILYCLVILSLSFSVNAQDDVAKRDTSFLSGLTPAQRDSLQVCVDSINAQIHKVWDNFNASARSIQTKSICGVAFGCSREDAMTVLKNKYGTPVYNPSNENIVSYKNRKYAGVDFDNIHFIFQSDGQRTFLSSCIFLIEAKSLSQAKSLQLFLSKKLEEKYRLNWVDEDTDSPSFYGGISPLWNDSYSILETLTKFNAFHSDIIEYDNEISSSLHVTHGVRLIYGPYDYVQEEF